MRTSRDRRPRRWRSWLDTPCIRTCEYRPRCLLSNPGRRRRWRGWRRVLLDCSRHFPSRLPSRSCRRRTHSRRTACSRTSSPRWRGRHPQPWWYRRDMPCMSLNLIHTKVDLTHHMGCVGYNRPGHSSPYTRDSSRCKYKKCPDPSRHRPRVGQHPSGTRRTRSTGRARSERKWWESTMWRVSTPVTSSPAGFVLPAGQGDAHPSRQDPDPGGPWGRGRVVTGRGRVACWGQGGTLDLT